MRGVCCTERARKKFLTQQHVTKIINQLYEANLSKSLERLIHDVSVDKTKACVTVGIWYRAYDAKP